MKSPEFFKTEKGEFETGFFYDGEVRKSFSLREEILSDNLREAEEVEEQFGKSLTLDDQKLSIAKNCVQFARRLKVEGIPSEKISASFLLEHLTTRDYSALVFAKVKLEKEIYKALGVNLEENENEVKKN